VNWKGKIVMGERFYLAQLKAIGTCPGINPSKRRRYKVAWEDEEKQRAIEAYETAEPTPETSMEIVKEIAEEMGKTPNGVRMILTKAEVYIKKTPTKSEGGTSGSTSGGTRVSKEDAQSSLKAAISDVGQEVDDDIISKLTGKAAIYLAAVINALNTAEESEAS